MATPDVRSQSLAETKEVIGGFAIFELKSKEAAIESTLHFMELHKQYWPGWEGETEIRQIFGPEDTSSENVEAKIRQMCQAGPAQDRRDVAPTN